MVTRILPPVLRAKARAEGPSGKRALHLLHSVRSPHPKVSKDPPELGEKRGPQAYNPILSSSKGNRGSSRSGSKCGNRVIHVINESCSSIARSSHSKASSSWPLAGGMHGGLWISWKPLLKRDGTTTTMGK